MRSTAWRGFSRGLQESAGIQVLVLVTIGSFAIAPSWGQTATTGNIAGYVRDRTGAALPSATVTARMGEQQFARTAATNTEGFYSLQAMPPGKYNITVESKGFQSQTQTGVELTVNQNLR